MKYYLRDKEITLEELMAKKAELDRLNKENCEEWNESYLSSYPEPGDGWEKWELIVESVGADFIRFWDCSDDCLY